MSEDSSNPYSSPSAEGPGDSAGPADYASVPLLRRNGFCSGVVVAHMLVLLLGGCVPFVGVLGIFTTIAVLVVCVTVLTGPVYYNKTRRDGTLKKWGKANKVAAVIILLLFVGGYGFLMYWVFAR